MTNLNTASASEIDALPDIGKARTKVILDERAKGWFKDWADFDKRMIGDVRQCWREGKNQGHGNILTSQRTGSRLLACSHRCGIPAAIMTLAPDRRIAVRALMTMLVGIYAATRSYSISG